MPTYCWRLPDGEVVEESFSMSDIPEYIFVDGVIAVRDLMSERPAVVGTSRVHRKPCDDLGVHPSQVKEVNELLVRRGCKPAEFDSQGSCIPDDRAHRRDIATARGMFDTDAGYGDKTPGLASVVEDNV